jgi:uroporphyrin-III C-methyltransferase/precorrin-2 dehydrogenase/sirohydrochlorin ferrochelatase
MRSCRGIESANLAGMSTFSVGYPLLLDLRGRKVLVVGGGTVAARRVPSLARSGAVVHVVAPEVRDEVAEHASVVLRRPYAAGDAVGAWLVLACASDSLANAEVAAEAEDRRILCVRADLASGGTARTPAVAYGSEVTVAVSASDDPGRARAVRNAVAGLLEQGALPVRRRRSSSEASGAHPGGATGRVSLVGGGPGDPGLITVRGRRLLAEADVVVVDRLAPRALLSSLDPDVEVVDAGKAPHAHNLTQEEINQVLVSRARAGRRVVRLKGGDPYVFGRGGEEVAACTAAGIPVEVVPGVTSAIAAPAAAGIPVTHRGVSYGFTVVSGHSDPGTLEGLDWAAVARGPDTIVMLMGVERLAAIAEELVRHGRSPDTPVAVVASAGLADHQVVEATLATVAEMAAGVRPPAVTVVGEVVRLRERLWSTA